MIVLMRSEALAEGYSYFEREGAYFRRDDSLGHVGVHDVRHGDQWVPFEGDGLKPVHYGDRVSAEEATAGMLRHAAE